MAIPLLHVYIHYTFIIPRRFIGYNEFSKRYYGLYKFLLTKVIHMVDKVLTTQKFSIKYPEQNVSYSILLSIIKKSLSNYC